MANGILDLEDKVIVGGVVLRKRRFQVDAVPPPPPEPVPTRKLRVFLCHASEDKRQVRQLKQALLARNVEPWLDQDEILPGEDWKKKITDAIRRMDIFLICFSRRAVEKTGYVQREIKIAMEIADQQPPDMIFLIPARLEECEVPTQHEHLQWVDLFEEDGLEKLTKSFEERAEKLGLTG